ncbi:MAG: HAMP domain-containing histidine kinase [Candidatus Nanopelagicales bacterium]|nr:HAMP domain-containing histidine kinase [Candidatus Nanopelagicales bacterium]
MRRRILLTLLASTSIVLIAFLVPLMIIVENLAVDRAQRQVVLEIQPLVSRVPVVADDDLTRLVDRFTAESGRSVTLVLADGRVVGAPRPLDPAVQLARAKGAFFAEAPGGRDLLIPVYTADGEAVLRVFVPVEELTAAVPRARLTLVLLGLALLAISVGLGLLLARAFLRPIAGLSATAERLAAGELAARVPPSGIREIDTAGGALNRLAGRVRELLSLEREEVADLAHRLRTPVAALRLDAETLPAAESSDRLRADVDRLEGMVDEVIREARRPLRADLPASADLCAVVRDRTSFWAVLAEDQGRPMAVTVPAAPVHVSVEERDLADALDALIGNVFSHTPEGCAFHVMVGRTAGGAGWVEVTDAGAGLPGPDVLARGSSEAGSTGLGLDIARRTAERAGGSIELGSAPSGGALVRLLLPAAPAGG